MNFIDWALSGNTRDGFGGGLSNFVVKIDEATPTSTENNKEIIKKEIPKHRCIAGNLGRCIICEKY